MNKSCQYLTWTGNECHRRCQEPGVVRIDADTVLYCLEHGKEMIERELLDRDERELDIERAETIAHNRAERGRL